jgi:hypothetical protein
MGEDEEWTSQQQEKILVPRQAAGESLAGVRHVHRRSGGSQRRDPQQALSRRAISRGSHALRRRHNAEVRQGSVVKKEDVVEWVKENPITVAFLMIMFIITWVWEFITNVLL